MMTSTSWTFFTLSITMMVMAVLAAPPASPSTEDFLGSRVYYRNRDTLPLNAEDNVIPMTLDGGGQQQQPMPVIYDANVLGSQVPSENALLTYLLTRRFAMARNNRLRSSYADSSSNEISRKRSYSKFCSFNAVSCFGK